MNALLSGSLIALLGFSHTLFALSFDEILENNPIENDAARQAFYQPLADVMGLLASSGTFHTGKSHGVAGFDLGVRLPTVFFDSVDGTILGEDVTDVSAIPMPMLVANKGLIKGFQIGARFMQIDLSEDVGELSMMGASLRWEANEIFHIPFVMPRVGLQANWSKLKIGDYLESSGVTFDLIVSKKIPMLEFYGGYTTGTLKSKFNYSYELAGIPVSVDDELDADVSRLSLGMSFTPFPSLRLNAEYGLADSNSLTLGLIMSVL